MIVFVAALPLGDNQTERNEMSSPSNYCTTSGEIISILGGGSGEWHDSGQAREAHEDLRASSVRADSRSSTLPMGLPNYPPG